MAFWDTLKHIAAQPVGWGAGAVGGGLNALPGYSSEGTRLNNISNSITNPNVVYTGALNPFSSSFKNSNGAAWATTNPTHPDQGAQGSYPQQTLGAETGSQDNGLYGQGGVDMNYRNGLADKLHSIISAYDSLNSGVDTISNDAIGNYNKQYDQQAGDLNNEYGKTSNQLSGQYGARGLADSSYYGNAQDEAKNTYNTNVQGLLDQRNQNLASIGQQAATAKAGYGSSRQQYADILGNLGNYGQADLNSLGGQLPGALSGAQQAQAGQGTQASFIQGIQGLPALQNNGASQLQAQLQKLSQTGAPGFAKNQLAQGIINQAQLQDPNANNQWSQYWQQLMGA